MTLKEAQKEWEDAIQMSVSFKRDSITEEELAKMATASNINSKVLFCEVKRTTGRCITSVLAKKEEDRQLSMIPGTKVIMTGTEAKLEKYTDKVWNISHGPHWMGGDWVVWLEGYSGAYSCRYLDIVQ